MINRYKNAEMWYDPTAANKPTNPFNAYFSKNRKWLYQQHVTTWGHLASLAGDSGAAIYNWQWKSGWLLWRSSWVIGELKNASPIIQYAFLGNVIFLLITHLVFCRKNFELTYINRDRPINIIICKLRNDIVLLSSKISTHSACYHCDGFGIYEWLN